MSIKRDEGENKKTFRLEVDETVAMIVGLIVLYLMCRL